MRAEEVVSKPAYSGSCQGAPLPCSRRRLLEWQKLDAKSKRPFAIALRSSEPYAFAGLWESWRPKEGEPLEAFAIITNDPNAVTEKLHDRMPAILEPADYNRWLDAGDPSRPHTDLLPPYPEEKMHAWPVSERVGNVRNNDPDLLSPAEPEFQSPGLFD
jgi:putative SOS response-associated peptidase YedK